MTDYNAILTQNLYASGNTFLSVIKAPVGNSRAFVQTVNQGLQTLVNNDVALYQRCVNGHDGSNTTLQSNSSITINGYDKNSNFNINVPLKLSNNQGNQIGGIYEASPLLIAPTEVTSTQNVGHISNIPKFNEVIISGSTSRKKLVNIYVTETTFSGKEVTLFLSGDDTCNMDVSLYLYNSLTDYNGQTGTNLNANVIHFGTNGFQSVTLLSIVNSYSEVVFHPVNYIPFNSDGSINSTYKTNLFPSRFAD